MDGYDLTKHSTKLVNKTRRHLLSSTQPSFTRTGLSTASNPYRTNTMLKTPSLNTNVWWVEGVGP